MLSRRLIIAASFFTVMALSFVMVYIFYPKPVPDPWPEDYTSIFSYIIDDAGSDFDGGISDAPTYIDEIDYPAANITKISLGIEGKYLYMRLDYASEVPSLPFQIAAEGNIEAQVVEAQGTSVALDSDNNPNTGAEFSGIEIFFSVNHDYGEKTEAYAKYNLSNADSVLYLYGEVGDGGMGYDYVVVRYDTSGLGRFFPRGDTVMVEFWSEAESDLYRHFAFEEADVVDWEIPQ